MPTIKLAMMTLPTFLGLKNDPIVTWLTVGDVE